MIDLLIDIGNSRIKLALVEDNEYEYLGAFSVENLLSEVVAQTFLEQLDFTPQHIFIASVSTESIEMEVRNAIAVKWGLLPIFMSTQQECCDVKNGYEKPFQLGVDRWLALLGARSLTKGDFIVVDAGTAITVDHVYQGSHQGGFIVPGLTTLRKSLTSSTANLSSDCSGMTSESKVSRPAKFMATDTQSAICGGTLYMASAFVNSLLSDLIIQSQHQPNIYFTGGDGNLLSSLLNVKSEYIEDLVLLGIINVKENIKKA